MPERDLFGLGWVAHWYERQIWRWVHGAAVVMLVTWDLGSWYRSGNKRGTVAA